MIGPSLLLSLPFEHCLLFLLRVVVYSFPIVIYDVFLSNSDRPCHFKLQLCDKQSLLPSYFPGRSTMIKNHLEIILSFSTLAKWRYKIYPLELLTVIANMTRAFEKFNWGFSFRESTCHLLSVGNPDSKCQRNCHSTISSPFKHSLVCADEIAILAWL